MTFNFYKKPLLMTTPVERLLKLGYDLARVKAAIPKANYVPFSVSGQFVYLSGHLPLALESGCLLGVGKVG